MCRFLQVSVCVVVLSSFSVVKADVEYQQTSRMTGGSLMQMMKFVPGAGKMREPQVSTVVFQGNRMGRRDKHAGEVIDLDQKTITNINFDNKTYTTMTFAQMKQMMEQMSAQVASQTPPPAASPKTDGPPPPDVKLDMEIKETGQTKMISGMLAKEFLLTTSMGATDAQSGATGSMKMDSSMWQVKEMPGAAEVHAFYMRMSKEIDWTPASMPMMNRPDMARGMSKMMAEGSKMDGTTILQTMRMYGSMTGVDSGQGGNANAAPPPKPTMSDAISGALGSKLGGLGSLGGFGRKKKETSSDAPPPAQSNAPGDGTVQIGTLMEMTIETNGFKESGVDTSVFQIPAGFKEVQQEQMPGRRGR